jgi:rhamnulokinase
MFIPDILNYFLTGEIHSEYTLSTISQLFNYSAGNWDYGLMKLMNIPEKLFPDIIMPGERCGSILPSICSDLHINSIPLITVGAHDTASAVVAVSEPDKKVIFISSGTWSIVGTETEKPVINETSFKYNYSNEGGVGGKIRLLKNVMGMWILQEIRRRFAVEGRNYSFNELQQLAQNEAPFGSFIDPDNNCFYEPANMPEMIRGYCKTTGQKIPRSDGEIVRCTLESLAFKYRYVIEQLERLIGYSPESIHIIGGGSQNDLLCQMTANCCKKEVYAGPVEATALGNAVTQLISLGELSNIREARSLIRKCFPPVRYEPRDMELWDMQYRKFLKVTKLDEKNK